MNKNKPNLKELERLSMITLTDAERSVISAELDELAGFAEILSTTPCDIDITSKRTVNATREDIPEQSSAEEILALAPVMTDGYIIVPKVNGM